MLHTIGTLLRNRNFILMLGIAAGMLLGDGVAFLKDFTPYIIGSILAVAVASFNFRDFFPIKKSLVPVGITILANYVFYSALIMLLSVLLIDNPAYRLGFVVIAATPPAIAIIPFTINLKGDSTFSIIGIIGGNVAGILFSPAIMLLFGGDNSISPMAIIDLILKMLVAPLIVSRLLRLKPVYGIIEKHRGVMIDWGFFLVAMTVIGISRDLLIHNTMDAVLPLAILLFMMFGLGTILQKILKRKGTSPTLIISNQLILTIKNAGFASVMAINLFPDPKVVLPAAILSVLLPVYYLVLSNMKLSERLRN